MKDGDRCISASDGVVMVTPPYIGTAITWAVVHRIRPSGLLLFHLSDLSLRNIAGVHAMIHGRPSS